MVSELRLRKKAEWLTEACQLLEDYLKKHRLRQTIERKTILETVFRLNGPVDIETLYQLLEMEMHVSKSTVYNALETLVDAKLVRKISLIEGGMCFYERAFRQQPHGFMVCRYCSKVTPIPRPEPIGEWLSEVPQTFHIERVSFVVHGICRKCQDAERKAIRREEKRRAELARAKKEARAEALKKEKTAARKR